MSVADVGADLQAAGAQIVWVLEADVSGTPGTAQSCFDFVSQESQLGWCVGDAQTVPEAGEWDNSPFSQGRGFDIVVPRSTMTIDFTTNHGTPGGNDNPSGAEVLEAVEDIIAGL